MLVSWISLFLDSKLLESTLILSPKLDSNLVFNPLRFYRFRFLLEFMTLVRFSIVRIDSLGFMIYSLRFALDFISRVI